MSFVEQMQIDIGKIKKFDEEVNKKVLELVEAINDINFEGLEDELDSRQVKAHKNKVLRVVNRELDKFAQGVDRYILPLLTIKENKKENKGERK